jgi:hypothetical protein
MALHAIVNAPNTQRGLFFALIVFNQQSRHGVAKRSLFRLQNGTDLPARLLLSSFRGEYKSAIYSVPKLHH